MQHQFLETKAYDLCPGKPMNTTLLEGKMHMVWGLCLCQSLWNKALKYSNRC